MTLLIEHWKPVVGFEGLYSVSTTGRVLSHYSHREIVRHSNEGYLRVCLYKEKRQHQKYVHILVAEAFISEKPPGMTVNHKNGWKLKNWPSNFEYLTNHDNTLHAVAIGINNRGSRHGLAKLTEEKVGMMRQNSSIKSAKEWAQEFGCHVSNVRRALAGESWRHVPK